MRLFQGSFLPFAAVYFFMNHRFLKRLVLFVFALLLIFSSVLPFNSAYAEEDYIVDGIEIGGEELCLQYHCVWVKDGFNSQCREPNRSNTPVIPAPGQGTQEKYFKCSELSKDDCDNNEKYPACKWNEKKNRCMVNLNIIDDDNIIQKKADCGGIFGNFWGSLKYIAKIFRIVAPIMVVALSTFEYVKALTSKDAEGLKKANARLIKRLILIVILIFLPTLIEIFLGLIVDGNPTTCLE